MKYASLAASFLAVLLVTAQTAVADPSESQIPITPVTNWKVAGSDGDKISLSATGDILAIDYDVNVNAHRLVGQKSYREASFTLELSHPVALSPDQVRITYAARVVDGGKAFVEIRPLIEDSQGERISYQPEKSLSLTKTENPEGWHSWRTQAFFVTEAGGATKGLFESEGGNAYPDGALRLVGLQVRIYADKDRISTGKRSGRVYLADLRAAGLKVQETPEIFADSFLKEKGRYRLGYEVRSAFQADPILEGVHELDFDPADENLRRQEFVFPLKQDQNNWIKFRLTDSTGKEIYEATTRWDQDVDPFLSPSKTTADQEKAPAIGIIRVNPGSGLTTGGLVPEDKPFQVTLRVFPPKDTPVNIEWTLRQYAFDTEISRGRQAVPSGKAAYEDVIIPLTPEPGRDAYRFVYRVTDSKGKTLDEGTYTLGILRPEVKPLLSRPGPVIQRDFIKRFPYNRTTFLSLNLPQKTESDVLTNFRNMAGDSLQLTNHITYMIDLAEFEILPGVYDFTLVDQIMDTAADFNVGITFRLAHKDNDATYEWTPYTLPRNFDGAALTGHPSYGSYSIKDSRYVDTWNRGFRALYDRYNKHRAFEGYYIMQAGGEWAIPDEPWNGFVADYSWAGIEGFRSYLKDTLKLDLAALNKRWDTSYKEWSEVLPPSPELEKGAAPNLRPEWIDFNKAKIFWRDNWFAMIARQIRTYDPHRVVIAYDAGWDKDITVLYGLVDYLHNGGNDEHEGEGTMVKAWEEGKLGWITEPHHPHFWAAPNDPGQRGWILDWSVYNMTAQAGAGGANLHVYYAPFPDYALPAHYGTIAQYDRMEHYKPILAELHKTKLLMPPKSIAVVQDHETLFAKHRTTFTTRLADLRRWFELLRNDSLDYEFYRADHDADYKLVVINPLDEVLSPETIEKVTSIARRGGWVVLSARSGQLSADPRNPEEFPLLRSLGIKPPREPYRTSEAGIAATLDKGQKLFSGRETIPFFSQADMAAAIKDPKTAESFWSWPYRWVPEADYFGYFPNVRDTGGEILARFPDGGVAASIHNVGKGKAIVFWGTPSMDKGEMKGVMAQIAAAAGVTDLASLRPIPLMLEARYEALNRYYALIYHETPGNYVQPVSSVPDGDWFVEEIVTGKRLGYFKGGDIRKTGVPLAFIREESPLKILRFTPREQMRIAPWDWKFTKEETK